MTSLQFKNGFSIPTLGIGFWAVDVTHVDRVVDSALGAGYRHLDCAYVYHNEKEVGEALKKALVKYKLKREDVFITSKPGGEDFPMDSTGQTLKYDKVAIGDTWKAMEGLVKDGLVKSIGVSNFNKAQLQALIDLKPSIPPVNLQIELHVNLPNHKLVDYAQSIAGLTVTAYSPLGSPGFGGQPHNESRVSLLDEGWVKEIASRYNKTPAQILLRYIVQRGIVAIPKSITPARIAENYKIYDFELSSDDMQALSTKGNNKRVVYITEMEGHPEYPFADEY